ALEIGGEAAAVQEDERLTSRGEVLLERGAELVRKEPRIPPAACSSAEVDQLDAREGMRGRTPGELEEAVPPGARRVIALGGGRGGGEDHDRPRQTRPHHRHVAGAVAGTVLLLVGG